MRSIQYIVFVLLIFACKKPTVIVIPTSEPGLVVNSNLCLDSLISFNLSYSQSITDKSDLTKESNATIVLYDKDTGIQLDVLINMGSGKYISAIKAKASKVYLAKIITSKNIFWTSDSVPDKADGMLNTIDTSIKFLNYPDFMMIQYSLNDKWPVNNYYGIKLKHFYEEFLAPDTFLRQEWLDIVTFDPILTEDINSKFSKQQLLFTDKYFNNQSTSIKFGTSKKVNNGQFRTKFFIVYMERYTFDAYAYYTSVNEHIFYQNDPFSQPINIKGNISNAYGAFIGKSIKADTIRIKY